GAEPVGLLRDPREVLADMEPGDGRRDGLELAAVDVGGVGLEVPGVLLRRAAPHEEHDARLRLLRPLRGGAEDVREAEAEQAQRAGAEELAAADVRVEAGEPGEGHAVILTGVRATCQCPRLAATRQRSASARAPLARRG